MMIVRSYRNIQILTLLATLFVLAASLFFQYVRGLTPCPLCIMQRVCIFLLLFFSVMGLLLPRLRPLKIMAFLQVVTAVGGCYFAGRQLWLQSLPAEAHAVCLPELDILIKYFPLKDVMHALIWGASDCAEKHWQWLGLSMPGWSLLYFVATLIAALLVLWRLRLENNHPNKIN